MPSIFSLVLFAFLVAFVYSSVGHGGASGYLALLSFYAIPHEQMAMSALCLNLLVSGAAFAQTPAAKQKSFLDFVLSHYVSVGVQELDQDKLTRISLLLGIFKALNILYRKKLADAWVQLSNTNPMFGGDSPLNSMIKGGVPAMVRVRQLVDARRGGR